LLFRWSYTFAFKVFCIFVNKRFALKDAIAHSAFFHKHFGCQLFCL